MINYYVKISKMKLCSLITSFYAMLSKLSLRGPTCLFMAAYDVQIDDLARQVNSKAGENKQKADTKDIRQLYSILVRCS